MSDDSIGVFGIDVVPNVDQFGPALQKQMQPVLKQINSDLSSVSLQTQKVTSNFAAMNKEVTRTGAGLKTIAKNAQSATDPTAKLEKSVARISSNAEKANESVSGLGKNSSMPKASKDADALGKKLKKVKEESDKVTDSADKTAKGFKGISLGGDQMLKPIGSLKRLGVGLKDAAGGSVNFSSALKKDVLGSLSLVTSEAGGLSNILAGAAGGFTVFAASFAVGGIIDKFKQAAAEAKALKEETTAVSVALGDSTAANTGLNRTTQILGEIQSAGGQGADAIKKLSDNMTLLQISKLINDTGAFKDRIAGLNKEINKNDFTEANAFLRTSSRIKNDLVNLSTAGLKPLLDHFIGPGDNKKLKETRDALNKLNEEAKNSQVQTLLSNAGQASELGLKKISETFKKQGEQLAKDGEIGKAYKNTIDETKQLSIAQDSLNQAAIRSALGQRKHGDATEFNAEAMKAGSDAALALSNNIKDIAAATENIDPARALRGIDPQAMAALSEQFRALQSTGGDVVGFTEKITASLGVDPQQADQIAQGLADFRGKLKEQYEGFKDDINKALPNIDLAFSEKLEFKQGGPTLKVLTENAKKIKDVQDTFNRNLHDLIIHGQAELAGNFSRAGVQAAGVAADQAAAQVNTGKTKAIADINFQLQGINNATIAAVDNAGQITRSKFEKDFPALAKSHPEILVDPKFGLVIDEAKKQQIVNELAAATTELQALVANKVAAQNAAAATLKKLPAGTNIGIRNDVRNAPTDEINAAEAKVAALQGQLDKIAAGAFKALTDQATTAGTGIHTAIASADIMGALTPQINNSKKEISKLPEALTKAVSGVDIEKTTDSKGKAVGSSFASNFTSGFINTFKTSFGILGSAALTTEINAFKEMGTDAGKTFATNLAAGIDSKGASLGSSLTGIGDRILDPLRSAVAGLNNMIDGANKTGKAAGVERKIPRIGAFHTGGIVGIDGMSVPALAKRGEQFALLQKGEGILPRSSMASMSPDQFRLLQTADLESFKDSLDAPQGITSISNASSSVRSSRDTTINNKETTQSKADVVMEKVYVNGISWAQNMAYLKEKARAERRKVRT